MFVGTIVAVSQYRKLRLISNVDLHTVHCNADADPGSVSAFMRIQMRIRIQYYI